MASYQVGQSVRLSVVFTVNGTATDPTGVSCKIKTPDGAETTYTYAAAQVTRDSTGYYHYDFTVAQTGYHYYSFTASGTVVASSSSVFTGVSDL